MKYFAALFLALLAAYAHPIATVPIGCPTEPCVSQPPPEPTGITGYFVDCTAGSDASPTPTNALTPWRTLAKVNSDVVTPGADVWIKSGSVCADQRLIVDWSGTAGDHVIIGTYYVSGGSVYAALPTNATTLDPRAYVWANARAEINGSYTSACSRTLSGNVLGSTTCLTGAGAVPNGIDTPLVLLSCSYCEIQSIHITESAGRGLELDRVGSGQSAPAGYHDRWVRYMHVDKTVRSALQVFPGLHDYVFGNIFERAAVGGNKADDVTPGHASMIQVGTYDVGQNGVWLGMDLLIENNDIGPGWGEGIIVTKSGTTVVRGNRVGTLTDVPIYIAECTNCVVEYNQVWGGHLLGNSGAANTSAVENGIYLYMEVAFVQSNSNVNDVLVRGNMIANSTNCIRVAQEASTTGKVSALIYGNTCVNTTTGAGVRNDIAGRIGPKGIHWRDNIFYNEAGGASCDTATPVAAGLDWDYNSWGVLPAANCRGTHDVTGNPMLTGSGFNAKTSNPGSAPPIVGDYQLLAGSVAQVAGTPLTSSALSLVNFPTTALSTVPCTTFDLTASSIDAACVTRNPSAPDMGALQSAVTGLTVAQGYFVDCALGSDASLTPTNPNTPWRTVTKVNSTVTAEGADVWIKAGTTCPNQVLTIDWDGTALDRVVVGSYFMQGGVAYELRPTVLLANPRDAVYANGVRAKIAGTTNTTCRPVTVAPNYNTPLDTCPFTWVSITPAAVPNQMYKSLVDIQAFYVTVQDLWVYGSAGRGINIGTPSSVNGDGWNGNCLPAETDCATYTILQRTKVELAMLGGIQSGYNSHVVMRENEVTLTSLSWGDGLPGVDNVGSPLSTANSSHTLIENSYVHDDYGDGVALYGHIALGRGNILVGLQRASLMAMGFNDDVHEQELVVSSPTIDYRYPVQTRGYSFWIMSTGLEAPTGPHEHWGEERIMYRANLTTAGANASGTNSSTCMHDYVAADYAISGKLDRISHKMIGNTCIATATGDIFGVFWDKGSGPTGLSFLDSFEVANNLFVNPTAALAGTSNPTTALDDYHHNQWTIQPTDTDLRGTGDVNSTSTGLGSFNFALASTTNMPTYLDFKTTAGAGAAAASAGDYSSTGFIKSDTTWDWVLSQRQAISICGANTTPVAKSEWIKDSAFDFCGLPRSTNVGGINKN